MRERRRDLRDMFDAALIGRVNRIRGEGENSELMFGGTTR
jgi:hypothetical protein